MTPRLSCIMPTANRRRFVPAAIAQFLAQGRTDAELVILDDGSDPVGDLVPDDPRIRYLREERVRPIGDKRNRLCELARGEIIVHWDDDDWHAPDRLARQLAALEESRADICGCDRLLFLADDHSAAWEYVYTGSKPWLAGGTLCYRRSAWAARPFPPLRCGEDTQWIHQAPRSALYAITDNRFYVARVHGANTSPKRTHGAWWQPRDPAVIAALVRPSVPTAQTTAANWQQDLTVVIPHRGPQRLHLLRHTLNELRRTLSGAQVIVVEQGPDLLAGEIAAQANALHLPISGSELFEKARAVNAGGLAATTPFVLWHDNDLVAAPGFYQRAVAEMHRSGRDFLIPYRAIDYLTEADTAIWIAQGQRPATRPLRRLVSGAQVAGGMGLVRKQFLTRYGGIDERFRGWGAEDNAWWHKVSLLGQCGASQDPAQQLWHLWHPASGGMQDGAAQRTNPHYRQNLAVLGEIAKVSKPTDFVARYPAPATPRQDPPVLLYWEGPCPDWILHCRQTMVRHGGAVQLIDRAGFEEMRRHAGDVDIDLDPLQPAHRADYARAWLLARHGGIWIDSDCLLMRPLDCLRQALDQHGFAAHRDRQDYYPNGFLAAAPGNAIAAEFLAAVTARLRQDRPLGWIDLGGGPLTRLLKQRQGQFHELPCAAIQPICWSAPQRFFHRADEPDHAAAVDPAALTYMLSNTEVRAWQARHPEADLLAPDSFFSHLLARSLGTEQQAPLRPTPVAPNAAAAPLPALPEAGRGQGAARVFASYHRAALRRRDDSLSGPGSTLAQTTALRRELPRLLAELGVRSMIDAGCGDHRWLAELNLGPVAYTGIDIVPDLIARGRQRGLAGRQFVLGDFTAGPLPRADLVLTRDTLVHYDLATALRGLDTIRASGAMWLLATTFTQRLSNPEAQLGGWRPLNLQRAPFNLPAPERLIVEQCSEDGGAFRDKALGLWRLDG